MVFHHDKPGAHALGAKQRTHNSSNNDVHSFDMDYSRRSICFAAGPVEWGELVCGFGRKTMIRS